MADRGGNDDGGHWWNRGPLYQLRQNHPYIANGLKYGGLYGGAAGAVVEGLGRLGSWLSSRGQDNLASMSNDRQQPDYSGGTNWDVSLGDPQSAGVRSGPPSDLAGPGTLTQFQDNGDAPAWYEDTTMNPSDPLGLVPDYGREGMPVGPNGIPLTPEGRRTYQGAYGKTKSSIFDSNGPRSDFQGTVTNFMVGGSPVILGSGDPNGRFRNSGRDWGG